MLISTYDDKNGHNSWVLPIEPYCYIGTYFGKWKVYSLTDEVKNWLLTQDKDKYTYVQEAMSYCPYALDPELEVWMKLKYG